MSFVQRDGLVTTTIRRLRRHRGLYYSSLNAVGWLAIIAAAGLSAIVLVWATSWPWQVTIGLAFTSTWIAAVGLDVFSVQRSRGHW